MHVTKETIVNAWGMAQHKYDLITVPTEPKGSYRHHPWYKERLEQKFLKNSKQSASLGGRRWRFLAGNLDDFRTGVPVQTKAGEMLKKRAVQPIPLINSQSSVKKSRPSQNAQLDPGQRTLYTKVGVRMQLQQGRLRELEESLLQHPIGLYTHLEESIPPEMLQGIVGILDPELARTPSGSDLSSAGQSTSALGRQPSAEEEEEEGVAEGVTDTDRNSGVYRWPLKKSQEERDREQSLQASKQVVSASQQCRVNQVTGDLVQWVQDLGGSDDGGCTISESTIKRLFGSDYETKPALVAPVHVVELLNIPAELRLESRERSAHSAGSSLRPPSSFSPYRRRSLSLSNMNECQPRVIKTKYGAWYLPVDLWRVRPSDEPLRDPLAEAAEAESSNAIKSLVVDAALADLHGAKAFKEFIVTNKQGVTMPKFLKSVATPRRHSLTSPSKKHVRTSSF